VTAIDDRSRIGNRQIVDAYVSTTSREVQQQSAATALHDNDPM